MSSSAKKFFMKRIACFTVGTCTGGSEGVFRCARPRGQSRRRCALGDDGSERDRVRGRITRGDV